MVIRRVGPLSVAKVAAFLYALIGLFAGVFFSLIFTLGFLVAPEGQRPGGAIIGLLMGGGALIFMPIFYSALGFVMTLVLAALYNWAAGVVGGVEIELEGASQETRPPSP